MIEFRGTEVEKWRTHEGLDKIGEMELAVPS